MDPYFADRFCTNVSCELNVKLSVMLGVSLSGTFLVSLLVKIARTQRM